MKIRLLTLGVVILVAVLVCLSAGCTTTTKPSPSPVTVKSTTQTTTSNVSSASTPSIINLDANEFTQRWSNATQNYTIVTPFTKSLNERGHPVYTGKYSSKLSPTSTSYTEITIEGCKDKTDTRQTYEALKANTLRTGYVQNAEDDEIYIQKYYPQSSELMLWSGYKPINAEEALNIIITQHKPDNLNIGYYVQLTKFQSPL